MSLTALPGDPSTLGDYAERYARIAESILETSRQLATFADDIDGNSGEAVQALAERAGDAGRGVAAAHPRYATTASTLTTYSVQLTDAQTAANGAISAASTANGALPYYYRRRAELTAFPVGLIPTEAELQDKAEELAQVNANISRLEDDVADAQAAYDRAVNYRDTAAQSAINAIRPVLDQLNDTLGDYVDAWVQSLPDFLQAMAQWIGDIFVAIVEAFEDLVASFIAMVIVVVTFVSVFVEILQNYPPELWLAALLAPGLVLPIILALTLYLAVRLTKEPLRPTPAVTASDPVDSSSTEGSHYADTMTTNVMLDDAGATDNTVIQIVEVLDENGERVGWRVILPSTQDWQELSPAFGGSRIEGDQGALNDLDSNLALMLTPSQQAAYERAVIQAMLDAGIGPNDPVMLSGWSQGGILAGALASDPTLPFTVQAVYVSGAPIDAMNIPDSVAVISVQHEGDVVHTLDGPISAGARQGPNWVTITQPAPIDPDTGEPYAQPHNGNAYTQTASTYIDNTQDQTVAAVVAQQHMFFSDNEVVTLYDSAEQPVPL